MFLHQQQLYFAFMSLIIALIWLKYQLCWGWLVTCWWSLWNEDQRSTCSETFFLPREMSCLESVFCGNHPLSVVNWTCGAPLASVDALLVSWVLRLGGEGLCFEMNSLKITSAEITSLLITCRILDLPPTPWREWSVGTGQRHKIQKVFSHIQIWKHPVGRKWEGVFWSS